MKVIEGLWQDDDVAQVEWALRVFESQLRWLARQDWQRSVSCWTTA